MVTKAFWSVYYFYFCIERKELHLKVVLKLKLDKDRKDFNTGLKRLFTYLKTLLNMIHT